MLCLGLWWNSKFFVDVIFRLNSQSSRYYGLDCKMRRELAFFRRKGRIYVEVTNASRFLWSYLNNAGITAATLGQYPQEAGNRLLEAISNLKHEGSMAYSDPSANPE